MDHSTFAELGVADTAQVVGIIQFFAARGKQLFRSDQAVRVLFKINSKGNPTTLSIRNATMGVASGIKVM